MEQLDNNIPEHEEYWIAFKKGCYVDLAVFVCLSGLVLAIFS
jgi:hypothetical protein